MTPFLLQKNFILSHWISRLLQFIFSYGLWIFSVRLLVTTCLSFWVFSFSPNKSFQPIQNLLLATEFYWIGLSAFFFIATFHWFYPLTRVQTGQIFDPKKLEQNYFSSFLKGYLSGSGIIFLLLFFGYYQYVGYYIQFEEAPTEFFFIFLRILTLLLFVYAEEFIFREKARSYFPEKIAPWIIGHTTAVLYCMIKAIQFELSWLQLFSLYLISLFLSYRRNKTTHFIHNAGYWAAILILFHPILSLPIFGNTFSGIFLIKCLPLPSAEGDLFSQETAIRWLTGGAGGPLSSLFFQALLVAEILRSMVSSKPS